MPAGKYLCELRDVPGGTRTQGEAHRTTPSGWAQGDTQPTLMSWVCEGRSPGSGGLCVEGPGRQSPTHLCLHSPPTLPGSSGLPSLCPPTLGAMSSQPSDRGPKCLEVEATGAGRSSASQGFGVVGTRNQGLPFKGPCRAGLCVLEPNSKPTTLARGSEELHKRVQWLACHRCSSNPRVPHPNPRGSLCRGVSSPGCPGPRLHPNHSQCLRSRSAVPRTPLLWME